MTRQPGRRDGVAKSRRPNVTNVALPPMTLRREDLSGIRISSKITMPRDTHEISAGGSGSGVDILGVTGKRDGGTCQSNFESWARAGDTKSAERTWHDMLIRQFNALEVNLVLVGVWWTPQSPNPPCAGLGLWYAIGGTSSVERRLGRIGVMASGLDSGRGNGSAGGVEGLPGLVSRADLILAAYSLAAFLFSS